MVLLTVGAQLVETVLVRGVVYTAEVGARILYWAGSATLGYLWPDPPPEPTEVERMQESIRSLEAQVVALREQKALDNSHRHACEQGTEERMAGQERERPEPLQEDQGVQGGQGPEARILPES